MDSGPPATKVHRTRGRTTILPQSKYSSISKQFDALGLQSQKVQQSPAYQKLKTPSAPTKPDSALPYSKSDLQVIPFNPSPPSPLPMSTTNVDNLLANSTKIEFASEPGEVYQKMSKMGFFRPDPLDDFWVNQRHNVRAYIQTFPIQYPQQGQYTVLNSGIVDGRLIPNSESFWEDLVQNHYNRTGSLEGYYPWEDPLNIASAMYQNKVQSSMIHPLLQQYRFADQSFAQAREQAEKRYNDLYITASDFAGKVRSRFNAYKDRYNHYLNPPQDIDDDFFKSSDPQDKLPEIWDIPDWSEVKQFPSGKPTKGRSFINKYLPKPLKQSLKPYYQRAKKALPYAGMAAAAAAAAGVGYGAYKFYKDSTQKTHIGRRPPFKIIKNPDGSYSARSINRPDVSITNPVSWFTALPYAIADSIDNDRLVDMYGPEWKQSKHKNIQLKLPALTLAQFNTLSPVNKAAYLKSGHSIPTK